VQRFGTAPNAGIGIFAPRLDRLLKATVGATRIRTAKGTLPRRCELLGYFHGKGPKLRFNRLCVQEQPSQQFNKISSQTLLG
jgi:hypothetical protein